MTAALLRRLQAHAGSVRASPAYRLVALASLAEDYRRRLERAGVASAAGAGVLVGDRGRGLPDKLVDAAGAELFASLRRPGPLPPRATERLPELVFDGVLEIETAHGFVGGARAYEAIADPESAHAPVDRLGRLAHAALAYVERLRLTDVDRICARLYYFNRVPPAPRWTRAYPDAASVHELLRCPALTREWDGGPARDARPVDWLSWSRRGDPLQGRPDQLVYKLYVSPAVDALAEVLPVLVEALTSAGARRFKVGPDAAGLLRPDKIVVYMADADELAAVAAALERALNGVAPHGVPFTAELARDGLLSWGGDPPPDAGPVGEGVESWRLSVTRRLAEYLVAAQLAELRRARPAEFALARLAIDGVDVRSFAPGALAPPRMRKPVV